MFPMSKEESLVTIENGGQVATLVKTIIQQNNEFGAKMIIYPKMVKACAPVWVGCLVKI